MTGLPTTRRVVIEYMMDILQDLDVQEDAGNPHEVEFINGIHPVDRPKKYVRDLHLLEVEMDTLLKEFDLRSGEPQSILGKYYEEKEEALNK